jgi:hypothetical protein
MTTTDIRLIGCFSKDIIRIAGWVKYLKLSNDEDIMQEINKQAKIKAAMLISEYNLKYCKIIIKTHAKNNIFEAIKRVQDPIDFSNEIRFYKQLVFPYVVDIIYNKINNAYEIMRPPILLTEQKECSICLCNIDNARFMTITRCNHYFHRNCLTTWKQLKRYPTCPNCRVAI